MLLITVQIQHARCEKRKSKQLLRIGSSLFCCETFVRIDTHTLRSKKRMWFDVYVYKYMQLISLYIYRWLNSSNGTLFLASHGKIMQIDDSAGMCSKHKSIQRNVGFSVYRRVLRFFRIREGEKNNNNKITKQVGTTEIQICDEYTDTGTPSKHSHTHVVSMQFEWWMMKHW